VSFIVYALPRSRTCWLSVFLTYGQWICHHEAAAFMRSIADVVAFFARPNRGTVETAAAPGWRLLQHHVPHLRVAVIRRPVEEVVHSVMHMDTGGIATYDEARLRPLMVREARDLDRIAAQPGVLSLAYADLEQEAACAALFEHCLPYRFDRDWWQDLRHRNIQADIAGKLIYYFRNRDAIEQFKRDCASELRQLARSSQLVAR
jgi:hypothetical protein